MTLRLLLISLVAALGLGLPAWPTIEGWVGGAQKWMNTRLASMDVRRGEERRYVIVHELLTSEMQKTRANRGARRSFPIVDASTRPQEATVAMHHPTSAREHSEMVARAARPSAPPLWLPFALPRLDDYLVKTGDTADDPASLPEPIVSPIRLDVLAILAWDRLKPAGMQFADTLAGGIREAADRDRDARAFIAMEASGELYFDGAFALEAEVGPTPTPELSLAIAGPEIPAETYQLPGFETMESNPDLYFDGPIQGDLAPSAQELAAVPPPADEAPALEPAAEAPALEPAAESVADFAPIPEDVFAPEETVVALQPAPVDPAVAPEVHRAVRLTREAVSAWVNVLTGPALVTVSRSSSVSR